MVHQPKPSLSYKEYFVYYFVPITLKTHYLKADIQFIHVSPYFNYVVQYCSLIQLIFIGCSLVPSCVLGVEDVAVSKMAKVSVLMQLTFYCGRQIMNR